MKLTLRPATLQDSDFIIGLILAGARKGHFYPQLADNKELLRKLVISTIRYGVQDESMLACEAWVGQLDGKERIGVILLSETEKNDNGIELSIIAVKAQYQHKGYGSEMLDAIMAHWLPHRPLYVRCYPASERLVKMLLQRDFLLLGETDGGTKVLRHERLDPLETHTCLSASYCLDHSQVTGRLPGGVHVD